MYCANQPHGEKPYILISDAVLSAGGCHFNFWPPQTTDFAAQDTSVRRKLFLTVLFLTVTDKRTSKIV